MVLCAGGRKTEEAAKGEEGVGLGSGLKVGMRRRYLWVCGEEREE